MGGKASVGIGEIPIQHAGVAASVLATFPVSSLAVFTSARIRTALTHKLWHAGSSGHQARNNYSDQPIHTYYDDIEPGTFKHRNHLLDWISAKEEEPLRTEFVTATGTSPPG
ncbi:hypothetical protein Q3G72_031346 [Acer saccharum]|nr:hypothetical protein Q3G72_031346 [Acer saccharum]